MPRLYYAGKVFDDGSGQPNAAGTVTVYENGTTTLATVYTDAALSTQAANPLTLGSDGRLPTDVYVGFADRYTVLVKDSDDAQVYSEDDAAPLEDDFRTTGILIIGGTTAEFNTSIIEAQKDSADVGIRAFCDGTLGNDKNATVGAVAKRPSGSPVYSVAQVTVKKHSGITNPTGNLQIRTQDGVDNYVWADDSDVLRISTTDTHVGTTSGTVVGDQTSDERVKTFDGDAVSGLSAVLAVDPAGYTFIDDADQIRRLGFSAQSMREHVPEAVYDTGEDVDGTEDTKLAMRSFDLIAVLWKAVQELEARVKVLENP